MRSSWFVVPLSLALFACSESEDSSTRDNTGGAGGSSGSSGSGGTSGSGGGGTTGGSAGSTASGGAGGTSGGAAGSGGCSGSECGGEGGSDSSGGTAGTGSGEPVFVAVGYDGLRIRSLDLGETWVDEIKPGNSGADDELLLRAITFGQGLFVAAGYTIWTSPDGKDWEEQETFDDYWVGGLQYGNDRFVATGGNGYAVFSLDAVEWQSGTQVTNAHCRSLAFGDGKFVTSTGDGAWFESADGAGEWTPLSDGHEGSQVAFCDGEFKEYADCTGAFNSRGRATAEGVTIRVQGGKLERSTNGTDFSAIPDSPAGGVEDVVVGYPE